jgi:hypothetical protein
LIGGLSRAAVAAAEGWQVRLRKAWATRLLQVIETSIAAIIYGFFFPPLPIWMALLYHRETNAYSGADLATRIAEW